MSCIHKNDVGTAFIVTVTDDDAVVDISSATALQLVFRKPSGTTTTVSASLYTNGTDGKMVYTATSGLLDEAGAWRMQGIATFGSNVFHSDVEIFRVSENL